MKKLISWQYPILAIIVLLMLGSGHAQSEEEILRAKVPFNFMVGTHAFPAGEYSLKPLFQNTLLLRDASGQAMTIIGTNAIESRDTQGSVKLVFHEYGGHYFLRQIWQPGSNVGREVIKSSAEIEMGREYSSGEKIALVPIHGQ